MSSLDKESGSSKKLAFILGGVVLVVAAIAAFIMMRPPASSLVDDVSGVWKSQATGALYVLHKTDHGYRLTIGGNRFVVESSETIAKSSQILLTVTTESMLRSIWTLTPQVVEGMAATMTVDKDGFEKDELVYQRQLTAADKKRIDLLKAPKKALWSPAYNCVKAASDVERMICADKTLADSDVKIAQLVKEQSLADDQKQWLSNVRNVCTDKNCLLNVHRERLAFLQPESSPYVNTEEDAAPADAAAPEAAAPATAQ
jgi:hypothetical protein